MAVKNRWGQSFTKGAFVMWTTVGGMRRHGRYLRLAPADDLSRAYGRQALVWESAAPLPKGVVPADHRDVVEVGLGDLRVEVVPGRRNVVPTNHPPANIAKWSPYHFGGERRHYGWLTLSGWRYDVWAPRQGDGPWTLYVSAPMMNPGPARRSSHASATAAAKAARQHSINAEKHAARGQRGCVCSRKR